MTMFKPNLLHIESEPLKSTGNITALEYSE